MLDALLAIGLLLTMATQLRPSGSPVGPGEVCLVIWVVPMLVREVRRLGPPLTPALSRLLIFWALFALAQSLGTLTALAIGDQHDSGLFLHDIMAYPLLAVVSCLSVVEPGAGRRLRRVAWYMVAMGIVCLVPQLAAACGLIDIPLINPWFEDRFQGWSENPNQLALLCAVLLLVSIHLADTTERRAGRIIAFTGSALAIGVGRLTKSDTFTFMLVAAGPIFLAMKLRIWLAAPGSLTLRFASAWIVVIALPLMIAAAAPLALSAVADPERLAMGLTKNGGKEAGQEADLRLQLWSEAISRGMEAGMLGLGPGPHLPMPSSILEARESPGGNAVDSHPGIGSIPNYEAHNTLLDLFTQGGLIAVLSMVWLASTAFIIACKARLAGLATLICGLGICSLTGLIIRPPIVWFAITLCLIAGDVRGNSAIRNWN